MKNQFYIILCLFLFCSSLEAQSIKLVFRYDDFMLKSDSLNEGVVRIFQNHQIPLVLGVIPCDSKEHMVLQKNYSFLSTLKKGVQNHSIEIALHGLNHLKLANGEFGNLKREEQFKRMHKGKFLLDSIFRTNVLTFIPPWNAYDDNTLAVMENLAMKSISSALCIGQSFSNSNISYFPETVEDFSKLISILDHNKNREGVVVVMFHNYTFKRGYSLAKLDSLLTTINQQKYLKCVSFQQLYDGNEISNGKRMNVNMESNLLSKYLNLYGVIQATSFVVIIRILNVLLYMALCLIVYVLSFLLAFKVKNISKLRHFIISAILLLFVGLSVWFHLFSPVKMILICAVLSFLWPILLKIKIKNISFE